MQLVINAYTLEVILPNILDGRLYLVDHLFDIGISLVRIAMIFNITPFDDVLVALAPALLLDITRIQSDPEFALLYPRLQLLQVFYPIRDLVYFD